MVEKIKKPVKKVSRQKAKFEEAELIALADDKIWVTVAYSVQPQSYESFKVDAGMSITLKPQEDGYKAISERIDKLSELVIKKVENIRDNIETIFDVSEEIDYV